MGATFFLVAAVTRSAMAVKSIDMALLSDISVKVLMRPSAPSVEMLLTIGLRTAYENVIVSSGSFQTTFSPIRAVKAYRIVSLGSMSPGPAWRKVGG